MNIKSSLRLLLPALFVPMILAFTAKTSNGTEPGATASAASPFCLQDVNGKEFRWPSGDTTASKPLLIWFTNLCGGCLSSLPMLDSLYRKEISFKADLFAISQLGSDTATVRDAVARFKPSFPILIDASGKISLSYTNRYLEGTCPMENLVLVSRDGRIGFRGHFPGMTVGQLLQLFAR